MSEEVSPRIGESIRRERVAAGLSQEVLAKQANVSRPTLARLETGHDITVSKVVRLAAVLGFRVDLVKDGE